MTVGKIQLAKAAKDAVPTLTTEQATDIADRQLVLIRKSESHDLRFARHMRRQIGKQLGQAGATIHSLRGELALLRQQKQSMVHSAIDELIRGAVVEAVPISFDADGSVRFDTPVSAETRTATDNPVPAEVLIKGAGD